MFKKYNVDQSRLPESYFETLAVEFEEHLPIAEVLDEIVAEARENLKARSRFGVTVTSDN